MLEPAPIVVINTPMANILKICFLKWFFHMGMPPLQESHNF